MGVPSQTRLRMNDPGDEYELEANRAAEQIMQMGKPKPESESSPTKARENSMGGGEVPPIVHDVLSSSGQELDASARAFFEPRFGHNFGNVRVHADAKAAESAQAVDAQAYTVGSDIIFASGKYGMEESTGRRLLAHELAHVAQHGVPGISADGTLHRRKNGKDPVEPSPESVVVRLGEEITKLAQRNAWTGVDRTYKQIEEMGEDAFGLLPDPAAIHKFGAAASRALGDMEQYRARLWLEKTVLDTAIGRIDDTRLSEVIQELSGIEQMYGAVRIEPRSMPKSKRKQEELQGPELIPDEVPSGFDPDARRSIEFAADQIRREGSFAGLLPPGKYTLGDASFIVVAGTKITDSNVQTIPWGD
jgi:Domain of unknown function (DUF4157)